MAPNSSLARILVSVLNSREAEWEKLSRVLHDEVGQVLSAVGLQLDVLRLDFENRVPEIASRTAEIQAILEEAITRVRDLSLDLSPGIAERIGLQASLERLVTRHGRSFPGTICVRYEENLQIPAELTGTLYKIAEQALENAIMHARCTSINVSVRSAPGGILLEVVDNGVGFSLSETRAQGLGLGLALMEYYSSLRGLQLEISSTNGTGTSVQVVCPQVTRRGKRVEMGRGKLQLKATAE